MNGVIMAFGGIFVCAIFVILMVVAPNMFMSLEQDAIAANVTNSSHNSTYDAGDDIARTYVVGFTPVEMVVIIVLILLSIGAIILAR